MKTRILAVLAATLLAGFSVPTTAAGHGAPAGGNGPFRTVGAVVAVAPLATEEVDDLLWMREEEKMARDVYLALYDIWQDRIFNNIARSEQRHFDAIGMKIAYFNLTDPALPGIGLFANAELQLLHDSLLFNRRPVLRPGAHGGCPDRGQGHRRSARRHRSHHEPGVAKHLRQSAGGIEESLARVRRPASGAWARTTRRNTSIPCCSMRSSATDDIKVMRGRRTGCIGRVRNFPTTLTWRR